jgi:hypothetical protein
MGAVKIAHDFQGGVGSASAYISAGSVASLTIGGSMVGGDGNASAIVSGGTMGAVKIGHDLQGGSGSSSALFSCGSMASLTIGGSMVGGDGNSSAYVSGGASIGAVKIAHDFQGGVGSSSAYITAGSVASLTIGGSMVGSSGNASAYVSGSSIGAVKIGHDLRGGTGTSSGYLNSSTSIASLAIGGSLAGGTANGTGFISAGGTLGPVTIGHDVTGGSITAGSLEGSGSIVAGRITSVSVGGSVISGFDNSAGGSLTNNASIRAVNDIGSIVVKGGVYGSVGSGGDVTKVVFSARGETAPTPGKDLAIGSIAIGGCAERLQILAGYGTNSTPNALNGNAQINSVSVGGDWFASDIVAGVQDGGAAGFGDAGDTIIGGGTISKIASILIGGVAQGTAAAGDRFGIESHSIGSLSVNGAAVAVPAAPGSVALSPITADVTARTI